jgi:hypothetical protein
MIMPGLAETGTVFKIRIKTAVFNGRNVSEIHQNKIKTAVFNERNVDEID